MTARRPAQPGDVLLAAIAQNVPPGTEQQGTRPVIVVANPATTGPQRFEVLVIVPVTKAAGGWAEANPTLYPRLEAGAGGLTLPSTVLIDQVQALDATRFLKYFGSLTRDEYRVVEDGLKQMFGFG